jgi:hypothetical protein
VSAAALPDAEDDDVVDVDVEPEAPTFELEWDDEHAAATATTARAAASNRRARIGQIYVDAWASYRAQRGRTPKRGPD